MSKFKAVIFDMDGTLLNSEALAKKFWRGAVESFGFEIEESFLDAMIGTSSTAVRNSFIKKYGESFDYDEVKKAKYKQEFAHYETHGVPLMEHATKLLSYLKDDRNLPLALGTSTDRFRTDFRLSKAGLQTYFSHVLCGDEVTNPKPDPETYLTLFDRLCVSPSECIIVEDSQPGVTAALSSGANVVWIKDMKDITPDLQEKVWRKANSLNEIITFLD
jgi:HAD superfamily hydrolase (TIGR01509 family)